MIMGRHQGIVQGKGYVYFFMIQMHLVQKHPTYLGAGFKKSWKAST